VAILATSPAVRAGLDHLLQADAHIDVTTEAASLEALYERQGSSTVLVIAGLEIEKSLSMQLFESVWEEGQNQTEQFYPALLVLTDHPEPLQEFLDQYPNAFGILPFESNSAELIAAIKALHQGLLVGPQHLLKRIFAPASFSEEEEFKGEHLTPRETEVLQLLSNGLANKQIALALGISEHTAKFHISSIYVKLGASNRTEAVRRGVRLGLILL
jgi:two-component system, NarL family, response regulator YdfI